MQRSRATGPGTLADAEQAESDRVTSSLAGLAVALVIVVSGLFLIHHLQDKAALEDCLMAHRLNCDAMVNRGQ